MAIQCDVREAEPYMIEAKGVGNDLGDEPVACFIDFIHRGDYTVSLPTAVTSSKRRGERGSLSPKQPEAPSTTYTRRAST